MIILFCAIMDVSVGGMFLVAIGPGYLMAAGDAVDLKCGKAAQFS
jgi:TRAP-type C4-dicarboxylate transport system permease large subunit